MTTRKFDDRLGKVERRMGRAPNPGEARKMQAIDGWLKVVAGKGVAQMSCAELDRLEQLFGSDAPMGGDASDLVLASMNQTVIDLEQRRQQFDRWPDR